MTRTYEDLDREEKLHVNKKAGALGIDPASVPNIEDLLAGYEPQLSQEQKWQRAWDATNEERRLQAAIDEANRDPLEDFPTAKEAEEIARKFQVPLGHIKTREEAAVELEAQQKKEEEISEQLAMKKAIEGRDTYKVYELTRASEDGAIKAVGKAYFAEELPSFEFPNDT